MAELRVRTKALTFTRPAEERASSLNGAAQSMGCAYFKVDIAPYPTFKRIVDTCFQNEAFARAHPLKQPGAPASV